MKQPNRMFAILDRDGTINEERRYLSDPDELVLLPRAAAGIVRMQALGMGIIIATNQSGLARGYYTCDRLEAVHERLFAMLGEYGAAVDGIYLCPHLPKDNCNCRKPKPGLIERAAEDFGFDPKNAFIIGDNRCDVDLGKAVGAMTILVRTGYGREVEECGDVHPDYVADNLLDAASVMEMLLHRETRRVVNARQ